MKKKQNRLEVIVCPYCGREYLPSEIYIPSSFVGNAKSIIRTNAGKIDTFFGNSMDLREEYTCDKCNGKFNINAKVSFFTKKKEAFNEEFSSKLNKKIVMKED